MLQLEVLRDQEDQPVAGELHVSQILILREVWMYTLRVDIVRVIYDFSEGEKLPKMVARVYKL